MPRSNGLVVVNGGTEDLPKAVSQHLLEALRDGLVRVAEEDRLTVLTGGTDAGIFQILGEAFEAYGGERRLIGVAPTKLVAWDDSVTDRDNGRVRLEPHHTHFVLIDTASWGGETELLLEIAREIGRHEPSVAVLASGGSIARREVLGHVAQGRSVVVLAGTGRLADDVAQACRAGGSDTDPEINEIVHRGRIRVVDVAPNGGQAERLASEIRHELERTQRRRQHRQRPALIRRFPRLRWTPPDALRQLVDLEDQKRYPALAKDFAFLSDNLLDAFRRCDNEALRLQNSFYLVNVLVLFGSVIATILGVVQAANIGAGFALGLAETVLAAVLGGSIVVATAKSTQRGYYTNRLKAERLRSEYFRYLARHGPYADENSREQAIKDRVLAIETASGLKA